MISFTLGHDIIFDNMKSYMISSKSVSQGPAQNIRQGFYMPVLSDCKLRAINIWPSRLNEGSHPCTKYDLIKLVEYYTRSYVTMDSDHSRRCPRTKVTVYCIGFRKIDLWTPLISDVESWISALRRGKLRRLLGYCSPLYADDAIYEIFMI